jgi:hypothetical protein
VRWIVNIAALLLTFSSFGSPQDRLQLVSSTPLPKPVRTRWNRLRVGCLADGGTLLALSDPTAKPPHEFVVLTPDAALKAKIDVDKVAGIGRADIKDFAAGPGGEIYVLAKRIDREELERKKDGRIFEKMYGEDPVLWLVRFTETGEVRAKASIRGDFLFARLAVFPSGSFLVVGYLQQPGPIDELVPFGAIFSQDASSMRQVDLPKTVLVLNPEIDHHYETPIPFLAEDGTVYVVMEGEHPALAVVGSDGVVARTVQLHIPSGYRISVVQPAGARLIVHLDESKPFTGEVGHDLYAELDIGSGDVLFSFSLPDRAIIPGCQRQSGGITAIDSPGTLDTFMAPTEDVPVVRGPNEAP